MNKEELIAKLTELHGDNQDTEAAHSIADDLLMSYIRDPDIKKAYDLVPKWCA